MLSPESASWQKICMCRNLSSFIRKRHGFVVIIVFDGI
jgi:hypothetical protein